MLYSLVSCTLYNIVSLSQLIKFVYEFSFETSDTAEYPGRTPRFLQQRIKDVFNQIGRGSDIIWKTYITQYIDNWRINYEYVYTNHFTKVFEAIKLKKPR